jgi:tetratricopeptide (TPR) repeat protein
MRTLCHAGAAVGLVAFAVLCGSCGAGRLDVAGGWDEERAFLDRRLNAALDAGDHALALALADSVIAGGERSPRILSQRARALSGLGRTAEMIADFEEAVLADYENCESHLHFATALMRAGKTGRAHSEFMEAKIFCDPRHFPLIYRNLAVAGIKLDRPVEARRYVEEGLSADPADPYLLGLKGMLVARESPLAAESLFARALAGGEESRGFLVPYALLLMNAGNAGEAVRALEKASAASPGDRGIRAHLAEALDRAGRPREAEAVLRGLLAERDEPDLRRGLAKALFRAGDYGQALDLYRGLEETPETMDRIAMCLHHLGRPGDARSWARRANAARPDWPQGMMNLAVILAAGGELDEALGLLERIISLDPENAAARANLELLLRARDPVRGRE